jgi:hypothetical protein
MRQAPASQSRSRGRIRANAVVKRSHLLTHLNPILSEAQRADLADLRSNPAPIFTQALDGVRSPSAQGKKVHRPALRPQPIEAQPAAGQIKPNR